MKFGPACDSPKARRPTHSPVPNQRWSAFCSAPTLLGPQGAGPHSLVPQCPTARIPECPSVLKARIILRPNGQRPAPP